MKNDLRLRGLKIKFDVQRRIEMELAEVHKRLDEAVQLLYENDKYLLEIDINERSITHRLGLYLQGLFEDWHVDCEYNRDGIDPKRIRNRLLIDGEGSPVYPDIIIHRRGDEGPNLLVIEAKKERYNNTERDLEKLQAYKWELEYVYAALLTVYTGKECPSPTVRWV